MKRILSIITSCLLVAILLNTSSCKKEPVDYTAAEIEMIEDFMSDRGMSITPTESGLYFMDEEVGPGDYPLAEDTVEVYYRGLFLNGLKFDSNTTGDPFTFIVDVTSVIEGWHEGVKLIKEGGEALLIVPSWLGYGTYGYGTIPGYTPLYFEIELLNIIPGPNH